MNRRPFFSFFAPFIALFCLGVFPAHAQLQCDVTRITDTPEESDFPDISADGSTLAFVSEANLTGNNADNSGEIFLYDIFSGTFTQVTDNGSFHNRDPGLSGDGSRVVFSARGGPMGGGGSSDDIWLYDAEADAFTPVPSGSGRDLLPDIDGAGELVTYSAESDLTGGNPDGAFEVFLYEVSTQNLTQVTDTPFVTCCLGGTSISTDGSTIGFHAFADLVGNNPDGNQEAYIYDIATTTFTQVSDSVDGGTRPPVIAGDASIIAYTMNEDPFGTNPDLNFEIFTYDPATQTTEQLTEDADGFTFIETGAIDGNGQRLTFDTDADLAGDKGDPNDELFIYNFLTDVFTQITDTVEDDMRGARIDDSGQRIVFFSRANITGENTDGDNEIYLAKCEPKSIPALGNYFNTAQPGWGLDIQRAESPRGDIIFVIWFTYRPDGTPIWYLAVGEIVGNRWVGNMDVFSWDGDSASATAVGTMTLEWSSDTVAAFSWVLNGDPGTAPVSFAEFSADPTVVDYTGHHFPPAQPGWGMSALTQGEVTVVTIYFYDGAGDPTWIQGVDFAADFRITPEMSLFDGPGLCPSCIAQNKQVKGATSEVLIDVNLNYLRQLKNNPNWADDLDLLFAANSDDSTINQDTALGSHPFGAIDLPDLGTFQTMMPLTPVDTALRGSELTQATNLTMLQVSPGITPNLDPVVCDGDVSVEFELALERRDYGDMTEDGAPIFAEDFDTAMRATVFKPGETTLALLVEAADTVTDAIHTLLVAGPNADFFGNPAGGFEMNQAVSTRINNVSGAPEIAFWGYNGAPPSPNCAIAE